MDKKIQAMIELDKRGKLSPTKTAALAEMRKRGMIPSKVTDPNSAPDVGGLKDSTKKLVSESMPWMSEDMSKTKGPDRQATLDDQYPAMKFHNKVGAVEPTLSAGPAEWRQNLYSGAEKVPVIGRAVGTAAGMAASTPFGGAGSPALIPVGAAAGGVTGSALGTLLKQIALPNANTPNPTGVGLGKVAVNGATSGMLDATMGGLGGKYGGIMKEGGPAATLDELVNMPSGDRIRTAGADFLKDSSRKTYRKLLNPPISNDPAMNQEMVNFGLDTKLPVSYGSGGVERTISNIKRLGRQSDDLVAEGYTGVEGRQGPTPQVNTEKALDPALALWEKQHSGATSGPMKTTEKAYEDFRNMHPEDSMPASEAQKLKRQANVQAGSWGSRGTPEEESWKAISTGLRTETEGAMQNPMLQQVNREQGQNLQILDPLKRAHERLATRESNITNLGGILGHPYVKEQWAFGKDAASKRLRPSADALGSANSYASDMNSSLSAVLGMQLANGVAEVSAEDKEKLKEEMNRDPIGTTRNLMRK